MWLLDDYKSRLLHFLDRHKGPALFLTTLFVIGVIFGALAVRSLDVRDKLELVRYVGTTLGSLQHPPSGTGALMLRHALLSSLRLLCLLWVLGISVVGVLGVMVLILLRGFLTGFVVAFLAAEMGGSGILVALAGHLPQSLLEVPAFILAGTVSLDFSAQIVQAWWERRRVRNFYPALAAYSLTLLGMGAILALAGVVESYLSPAALRAIASLLQKG